MLGTWEVIGEVQGERYTAVITFRAQGERRGRKQYAGQVEAGRGQDGGARFSS